MSKTLLGIATNYSDGELSIFVGHRDMKTSDGEPVFRAMRRRDSNVKKGKKEHGVCALGSSPALKVGLPHPRFKDGI
ncbi:hypothetical protein [Fontibacillus panacisegetis]|uniref:hypothetical protein n=1 Tax=Fontibacillus panacisegetis TaxID=670482 RepID=UPI001113EC04|nr:hypothetical protein [Fontibacillus panacisegetis]